jgi:hypothetical protein
MPGQIWKPIDTEPAFEENLTTASSGGALAAYPHQQPACARSGWPHSRMGSRPSSLPAHGSRHIAGTAWSSKRYLNIELLKDQQMRGAHYRLSQRQAPLSQKSARDSGHCLGCARMMVRYRSRKSNDAELRARLRGLTHKRRRFGYRGLHVLLKRQGDAVR